MKIAICDDDKAFSDWLYKYMNHIGQRLKINFVIDIYNNPLSFKKVLLNKEEMYEVIILDIDMGAVSGLDIASILHNMYVDVLIIFLSAYTNYVYEAIKYAPFRYVRKDKIKIELNEAIESAYRNIDKNREQYYYLKKRTEIIKIKFSNILYFDIFERKVRVVLSDGSSYTEKNTIKKVMNKLSPNSFCQIHSGIIVNMKHIVSYNKISVKLSNKEELPISKYRFKDFVENFMDYIGDKI